VKPAVDSSRSTVDQPAHADPPPPRASTRASRLPIAREGHAFIVGAAVLAVLLFLVAGKLAGAAGLLFAVYVASFFRDPERAVPGDPDAIVAPADGRVIKVAPVRDDRFLHDDVTLVSIFMSPLNVHVNRIPAQGSVVELRYNHGKYFRAFADKASLDNEQNAVLLKDKAGRRFCFVQIAGFVARRIVCHLQVGMEVQRGQRCGMIMFGSRVDVYLPRDVPVRVRVGDRVRGASTVIAEWP
jgi:phosphatidylserine decarboxylase